MKPRYTKRVREEAALICAIAASGGVFEVFEDLPGRYSCVYMTIYRSLGTPTTGSLSLAVRAYVTVTDELQCGWTRQVDAEAEALIRCGWSPS